GMKYRCPNRQPLTEKRILGDFGPSGCLARLLDSQGCEPPSIAPFCVRMEGPMFSALFKETLAPLALRLAPAAIFIVHGWEKVYEHNGGASWANHVWADQQKIPPEVENKVKPALAADKRRLLEDKEYKDLPADFRKKVEQLEADTLSGIATEYSKSAG